MNFVFGILVGTIAHTISMPASSATCSFILIGYIVTRSFSWFRQKKEKGADLSTNLNLDDTTFFQFPLNIFVDRVNIKYFGHSTWFLLGCIVMSLLAV